MILLLQLVSSFDVPHIVGEMCVDAMLGLIMSTQIRVFFCFAVSDVLYFKAAIAHARRSPTNVLYDVLHIECSLTPKLHCHGIVHNLAYFGQVAATTFLACKSNIVGTMYREAPTVLPVRTDIQAIDWSYVPHA